VGGRNSTQVLYHSKSVGLAITTLPYAVRTLCCSTCPFACCLSAATHPGLCLPTTTRDPCIPITIPHLIPTTP
jgi:hypothetical protein